LWGGVSDVVYFSTTRNDANRRAGDKDYLSKCTHGESYPWYNHVLFTSFMDAQQLNLPFFLSESARGKELPPPPPQPRGSKRPVDIKRRSR